MGFAQEIRDFTAAYGAVRDIGLKEKDQKLKEKQLNHDIEYDNALLELKKQEAAAKQAKLAEGSGGTGGAGGAGGTGGAGGAGGSGGKKGAIPLEDGKRFGPTIYDDNVTTTDNRTDDYNNDAGSRVTSVPTDEELDAGAAGGDEIADEVLGYEKGGLVEDEKAAGPFKVGAPAAAPAAARAPEPKPAGKPPAKMPRGALPVDEPTAELPATGKDLPVPKAPAAAEGAPAEGAGSKPTTVVIRKAMEATAAALDSFEQKYSVPQQAVGGPEDPDGVDLATGEGGMTFEEYESIAQTVDPNNEIPRQLQSAANISATYDFFMNRGEPERAVKAAKGYLVAELRVNQTLGALAEVAFENGNIVEGCKILNDACSRFPSGHSITVSPSDTGRYVYEVRDPEGNVVEKEQIGTDELMESIQGIKDGSLYKKMLAHAVVAARPKKEDTSGSYTAALDGVKSANAALVEAISTYESMPEDASLEDRQKAYATVEAASTALEQAKATAKEGGAKGFTGGGNRVAHEGDVWKEVESAAALPEGVAVPGQPQPEEPGWWERLTGGGKKPAAALPTEGPPAEKSALPPPPDNVLQAAKAAIAKGAPPDAVAARLKEQGYSAEGL